MTRFVIPGGGNRSIYGIALATLVLLVACDEKKPTDATTPAPTASGPAIADDAIPVAADFEAEAESITPDNVEAEVAKLEAEIENE